LNGPWARQVAASIRGRKELLAADHDHHCPRSDPLSQEHLFPMIMNEGFLKTPWLDPQQARPTARLVRLIQITREDLLPKSLLPGWCFQPLCMSIGRNSKCGFDVAILSS
jgi:hypothetical protein